MYPPRISSRPFLLELLAVALTLIGAFRTLNVLLAVFTPVVWGSGSVSDFLTREVLVDGVVGVAALAVSYALWKEYPWSRPTLVIFLLALVAQEWVASPSAATLGGSVFSVGLVLGYFYLWPNTVEYYWRLRQSDDPGASPPNPRIATDASRHS